MTVVYRGISYEIAFDAQDRLTWVGHTTRKGMKRTWRQGQPLPPGLVAPVRYARAQAREAQP